MSLVPRGAALCAIWFALAACASDRRIAFAREGRSFTVHRPALYPETIEYDRKHDRFLLSSLREGAVYALDRDGVLSPLIDDPELCSVLGIALDEPRDRLWLVNSDLGSSRKPSAAGPKQLAGVGIYRLSTGKRLESVDLAPLSAGQHLLNGIALDSAGNAYVTDSFQPLIYKIDAQGHASVFARDPRFVGEGINLNGIVVHPDGYLLAIKKSDGTLFKIPVDDPARLTQVRVPKQFIGGDGLTLIGKHNLLVIANRTPRVVSNAAFSLTTDDAWTSAQLAAVQQLADVYPTTAARRGGTIYVLSSKLNELIQAAPEQKARLSVEASIVPIARVVD